MSANKLVPCPTCDGDGYLGDPEIGASRCRRCSGRGRLLMWELDDDEMPELEAEQEGEA